jgi:NAD(P)H-quinone oxidoreductase subunit 1
VLPSSANLVIFLFAPVLTFLLSQVAWAVIPFGEGLVLADLNVGLLYLFAISSLGVYGIITAGWSSISKYAFLGSLRSAAQMVSYEVSIGLILITVLLCTGSLNLSEVVRAQTHVWFCVPLFPLLVMFFISCLAETNRAPFDLPEAEEELVAGYQTEYSGMKFALYYLASYVNLVLSALIVAVLYLGGWDFPIPVDMVAPLLGVSETTPWLQVILAMLGITMTVLKAYLLVFTAVLLRWTLPRVRIDQLLNLGWKFLLPVGLVNLLLTAALKLAFPVAFGG